MTDGGGVCPACGSPTVTALASLGPIPVLCGTTWGSAAAAASTPAAAMDLACCDACAHVWNAGFDEQLMTYDGSYDNALDFSPTFRAYSEALVSHLVERFGLSDARIAEIGCGDGAFLRRLCEVSGSTGLGYDPSYTGPRSADGVEILAEPFTAGTVPGDVDLVCCRHVLEHVEDPLGFLVQIRAAVGPRSVPMYFEVPNADFNFAESGPWDLIYPHVAYFNEVSLRAVLARAGFEVLDLRHVYDDQFLAVEVLSSASAPLPGTTYDDGDAARSRRDALDRQLVRTERWQSELDGLVDDGPVALWGAGSKGVTFLSLVDRQGRIGTVVDANPRKWGRFLPGTGHQVVSPDELVARGVSTVLVMNEAYVEEISRSMAELGTDAKVLVP